MKLKQSAWEKAKKITMFFEGSGYDNLSGNFDGMDMSLGWCQWNFGSGSLQPLFLRLFNEYPQVAESILPEGGKWLKAAIEEGWTKAWATNALETPTWVEALHTLCQTPEFQKIQDDAAEQIMMDAVGLGREFGLEPITDRALSLLFDICTQNGRFSGYPLAEPTYQEKLIAIAECAINQHTLEKWRYDVRARKYAIIYGFDQGRGWPGVDFDDQTAFEEDASEQPLPQKDWKEILYMASDSPQVWEAGINAALNAVENGHSLGELEVFKYLPQLIEKIYNLKGE